MTMLKGLGWGCKTALAVTQLEQMELDFFYTWGLTPNLATGMKVQPQFVPMCWSDNATRLAELPNLTAAQRKSGYLLGFNEPDLDSQSNMTTGEAVNAWAKLEATGLKLVSPVTVSPNVWWMDTFMDKAAAAGLRIDVVAAHIYMNPHAGTFLGKVREMYEKWGKPIWITETAVADFSPPNTYRRAQTNDYLQEIFAGCKALGYVERFAWKTRAAGDTIMPTSTLFHSDGSLTSTGRVYAAL